MGDYQSIVAMPSRAPFPTLGKETAINTFAIAAPSEVWTLANMSEIPNVLLHFDHQVRRLEIEVVDASGARCTRLLERVRAGLPVAEPDRDRVLRVPVGGCRLHSNGNGSKAGLAWKTVPDGSTS